MYKYNTKIQFLQEILKNLSHFQREIFNILVNGLAKYKVNFLSQSTLARWVGCSRKTANRAIKRFQELNLLHTFKDAGYPTLVYRPHENILSLVSDKISLKIIPALRNLKSWGISQWFVNVYMKEKEPLLKQHLDSNVPLSIRKKNYYNNYSYSNNCKKPSMTTIGGLVSAVVDRFKNKSMKTVEKESYLYQPYKKEEAPAMNNHSSVTISPILKTVTERLGLSKAGQIRLVIYDDKALSSAYDSIKSKSFLKDPFLWFEEYCRGFSYQHKLPVKVELLPLMMKRYNLTFDDSPLEKKATKPVEESTGNVTLGQTVRRFVGEKQVHPSFAQYQFPGNNF